MTEQFTSHGLDLSADEVREVLAWVDDPTGYIPECLTVRHMIPRDSDAVCVKTNERPGFLTDTRLTPALVAEMRDWLEPLEAKPRARIDQGTGYTLHGQHDAVDHEAGPGDLDNGGCCTDWCVTHHRVARVHPSQIVHVRRPRVTRVRLGDVPKGTRVRYSSGVEALAGAVRGQEQREVWTLDASVAEMWTLDTLVEVVEEPTDG